MDYSFDKHDYRILNALQTDNSVTNLELADLAALSAPTCLRRVRRLREEGVIRSDVSLIDPDKVGSNVVIIVEIELRVEERAAMKAFEQVFLDHPWVMQCYLVTGEVDYVLVLCVRDMKAYEHFASTVLYSNNHIKRFRTLTTMKVVKFKTKIDLPLTGSL